jgi:hypothetical protein
MHIHWKWVKGHASRRKQPENFTMAETLNEAADALATEARSNPRQAQHTHWPEQKISLIGPYGRVSGCLASDVQYCCTAADIQSYWQQRYGWSTTQVRTVCECSTEQTSMDPEEEGPEDPRLAMRGRYAPREPMSGKGRVDRRVA